ncbi:MAG: lipid-binding SYLF domain-containing protein [Verrucomicrobiota bacterium]
MKFPVIAPLTRAGLVLALTTLCTLSAAADDLAKVTANAATIFSKFQESDKPIPAQVIGKAKAMVIMDTTEGGVIFTGKSGAGVMVHRVGEGWSGPIGIGTSGASFGLSIGGQDIRTVFLLMDNKAVDYFVNNDDVEFKGEFSGAAGPSEAAVRDNFVPDHSVYSYIVNDGVFGGMGVQGGVISYEKEETFKYYSQPVTIKDVLTGKIKPPESAQVLLRLLDKYPPAP